MITTITLMFFVVAPALDYPLTWEQGTRIVEIVIPVFLGYLGSATHFLFQEKKRRDVRIPDVSDIGYVLIRGPVVVFVLISSSALFAFGYSNRSGAQGGSGMSVDTLAWAITSALGILAVTTSVATSYLFALERRGAKPSAVADARAS
jgi:hypothetical protein